MLFSQLPDIDECSSSPCENDGICTDAVNMFTCSCAAGYSGDNCETSKFSIILYNVKNVKVKKDLQNNFISTNKVDRIKVQNDQLSPVTCRLLWKSHLK